MVNGAAQQITLTKKEAFAMCKDLLHGFSSADFQTQLKALMGGRKSVPGHLPGRGELALMVQRKVLPNYGFLGTQAGVNTMYEVMRPLFQDPLIHQMQVLIADKLGMHEETTAEKLLSLFRSDSQPTAGRNSAIAAKIHRQQRHLTKCQFLKIGRELVEKLSHPTIQACLEEWSEDDVQGRIKLALMLQTKILSAHDKKGVDNIFYSAACLSDGDSHDVQTAIREVLRLNKQIPLDQLMSVSACLTKEEALSITRQLVEGFCTPDFQKELRDLKKGDTAGRKSLALSVQKEVLPDYGIPATSDGVEFMLMAIAPYMNDWKLLVEGHGLQQMIQEIENKLDGKVETSDDKLPMLLGSQPQEKAPLFRVGDHVWAKYKDGKWYSAVIAKDNDDTSFTIAWDDGEQDDLVKPQSLIKSKKAEAAVDEKPDQYKHELLKEQAYEMVWDFLAAFSTPDFQLQLQKLTDSMPANYQNPRQIPGRSHLELAVKSAILPKHGFPGTADGEMMMLESILPFKRDWMLQQMMWAIDVQVGKSTETILEWLLGFIRKYAKDAAPLSLTKVEVLQVSKELLLGFNSVDFQMDVKDFLDKKECKYDMPGRMELTLKVASKVLPKYDIPGTDVGVALMLEAISWYVDDEEVRELYMAMIGLVSPFIHDWVLLMDDIALEDVIDQIDCKLDEIAEIDSTDASTYCSEGSEDKFSCSDLKGGMKIAWRRQFSANSEVSTTCGDAPDTPLLSPRKAPDTLLLSPTNTEEDEEFPVMF